MKHRSLRLQPHADRVILEEAIENTNEAFVTIDRNHRVLIFNTAAEEMFGFRRDEVLGRDVSVILPEECLEGHRAAVARYIRTGNPKLIGHETEFTVTRSNGDRFPASISFSVSHVDKTIYFTAIIRDLTEKKILEDRVKQSERLAAVGQLVAEISHEIRNPLMMIGGFARQLMRKTAEEKDLEKLRIICEQVSRLEGLLSELRDLYRPSRLSIARVDLIALLKEVAELAGEDCRSRNIEIHLEQMEAPLFVEVDRDKIEQVLLNLLRNAVEAMEETGDTIRVLARRRDGEVEIVVADNGPGIPPEIQERVLDPFFTTKKQGTGLGLAVCRRIVEDHEGRLFLHSTPGKGTEVHILLPQGPGFRKKAQEQDKKLNHRHSHSTA